MKKVVLHILYCSALLLFFTKNVDGQIMNKTYIGTYDKLNALYIFDSTQVKILISVEEYYPSERGYCSIESFVILKNKVLIGSSTFFKIKDNGEKLVGVKKKLRGTKDKLYQFNEDNPNHKRFRDKVILLGLDKLCD